MKHRPSKKKWKPKNIFDFPEVNIRRPNGIGDRHMEPVDYWERLPPEEQERIRQELLIPLK